MTTYAIGDLQGCYDSLMQLLDKLQFSPEKDTLWLVGDLVCRGSQSLETLRFLRSMESSVVCVLGNHDISLLASHYGLFPAHSSLRKVMQASDRDELMHWLRHKALLHVDKELDHCMVHAGISPHWTLNQAIKYAHEIETALQGDEQQLVNWFTHMYKNRPRHWSKYLKGYERQRYILNSFTRMRYCNQYGKLNFKQKLSPHLVQERKPHLMPWFNVPKRKKIDLKIIFGHWSTLGYYNNDNVTALDTGCVWSGQLTAYSLDQHRQQRLSIQCN
jgi:bis(5'-nucleosyl)-tetraphosphatase (symmetrical)